MKTMLKTLLIAVTLAVAAFWTPAPAKADHNGYWRNHWGWYDNTYRPYYNNYYGPSYGGYYGPSYGGYYGPSYGGGYYSSPYYGGGYYGGYYGPGVHVRIGNRASFGWW